MPSFSISPLGDQALLIDYGGLISTETNRAVFRLFQQLKEAAVPFVTDLVPAYSSLAVCYDCWSLQRRHGGSAYEWMAQKVQELSAAALDGPMPEGRHLRIPVCYGADYGPDLPDLARFSNMTAAEVVQVHSETRYRVFMIGFLPGFPYLGTVDERISMPRRATPRTEVPAGSVGIAGRQTGIYPLASPGGWQIIGRTPIALFRPENDPPVVAEPGDEITFFPISQDEFENYQGGHF